MLIKSRLVKVDRQKSKIKITFDIPLEESDIDFETLNGMPGWLMFQGKPITKEVEDAINNKYLGVEKEGRTYSQKLRGVIAQIWGSTKSEKTLDEFYATQMQIIIDHFKAKCLNQ